MSQNLNQPNPASQSGTENSSDSYYSLEVVVQRTGLGVTMVQRCVTYGIITPQVAENQVRQLYTEGDLARLRKVRRLVSEVGLNWAGVEVVMRLTDELEQLQQELKRLRGI